jgi:hypothetical protein
MKTFTIFDTTLRMVFHDEYPDDETFDSFVRWFTTKESELYLSENGEYFLVAINKNLETTEKRFKYTKKSWPTFNFLD